MGDWKRSGNNASMPSSRLVINHYAPSHFAASRSIRFNVHNLNTSFTAGTSALNSFNPCSSAAKRVETESFCAVRVWDTGTGSPDQLALPVSRYSRRRRRNSRSSIVSAAVEVTGSSGAVIVGISGSWVADNGIWRGSTAPVICLRDSRSIASTWCGWSDDAFHPELRLEFPLARHWFSNGKHDSRDLSSTTCTILRCSRKSQIE